MMATNSGTWRGSANGQKLTETASRLSTAKNAAASTSGTPTIQNRSFIGCEIEPNGDAGQSEAGSAARAVERLFGGVELFAQLFAGLEERHGLFRNLHGFAGARVAPDARLAALHGERAEAAQLDPVAARERAGDLVEDRGYDALDVALVEMWVALGELEDEFGFGHGPDALTCSPKPSHVRLPRLRPPGPGP